MWFAALATLTLAVAAAPDPEVQLLGTEIRFDWRGAHQVGSSALDAAVLDAYGDVPAPGTSPGGYGPPLLKNPGIAFSGLGPAWTADPGALDGSRYVQARITFVSETIQGVRPRVDSLGLGWAVVERPGTSFSTVRRPHSRKPDMERVLPGALLPQILLPTPISRPRKPPRGPVVLHHGLLSQRSIANPASPWRMAVRAGLPKAVAPGISLSLSRP